MEIRLTTLGVSSASPTTDRYPSAHVLEICGRLFLIDCGECCQMLLKRHHIPMLRLNAIFISHLHGDHYFGLFGLLSSMSLAGRIVPLRIYGPSSLEEVLNFYNSRMNDRNTFETVFTAVDADFGNIEESCTGAVRFFEDEKMEVFSFPLKHRIPVCGYLFREKPAQRNMRKESIAEYGLSVSEILQLKSGTDVVRENGTVVSVEDVTCPPMKPLSFAYCSDTAYLPDLHKTVAGVDLIYHEATFAEEHSALAAEMFHSTARQAAMVAAEAGAGQLVIGHFSSRYKDLSRLLSEARSVFPDTSLASEGESFSVVSIAKKSNI